MSAQPLRRPRSIAVLGAVLALALAGCGERSRHAVIPAGATVVALGDSLTYGTGAESASSYPSVLAALTAWHVVNAGVPGETAAQGCDRLPGLIAEHRPALVLVLLGGNDFLRRRPDAAIRDDLAACAASARGAATTLVLNHNVYVVLLEPAAARLRAVRAANPRRDPKKPCVYVGMTGLDPEERLANHRQGIKDAPVVKRYGLRLLPELYAHLNPMPFEAAAQMEMDLA